MAAKIVLGLALVAGLLMWAASRKPVESKPTAGPSGKGFTVQKSETEWKKQLTDQQYHVLREKGTERAFTGALWNNHEDGTYKCAGCGNTLFASDTKFDSGTGWPSFYQPADKGAVHTEQDKSLFMVRTEVVCAECGGHLGHVFDDGPKPTGLRYCINSAALQFVPEKDKKP